MHTERLKRFEALLRALPQTVPHGADFDLNHWGDFVMTERGNVCHTAACAGGWAAMDPWFQKEGLHLRLPDNTPLDGSRQQMEATIEEYAKDTETSYEQGVSCALWFGLREGMNALSAFFEVPKMVTRRLASAATFDYWGRSIKPEEVADRVATLLALGPNPTQLELLDWATALWPIEAGVDDD